MSRPLFVYGSLRIGGSLHKLVNGLRFRGYGLLMNAELFDLGEYPGVVYGNGLVLGELYEYWFEDEISDIDYVESIDDIYVRVLAKVCISTDCLHSTYAWVYFYPRREGHTIMHGDYMFYLLGQHEPLYVVIPGLDANYASNLGACRILDGVFAGEEVAPIVVERRKAEIVAKMLGGKLGLVDCDCDGFRTLLFGVTRAIENTINNVQNVQHLL